MSFRHRTNAAATGNTYAQVNDDQGSNPPFGHDGRPPSGNLKSATSMSRLKRPRVSIGDGDEVETELKMMRMETVEAGSPKAAGMLRSASMAKKLPTMSELRMRKKVLDENEATGTGEQPHLPTYDGDADELFRPHGKRLLELPTYENMKVKRMLVAARFRAGTNVEDEKKCRWAEVTRTAYSEEQFAKVSALLALGFPPAVLSGLKDTMMILDAAVMYDEPNKGDLFSTAVTKVSQLLGIRTETAERLMTVRATNMKRVMENIDAQSPSSKPKASPTDRRFSVFEEADMREQRGEADPDEASRMMTGSRGLPVVTFDVFLDNIIMFTPLSSPEEKLDLLLEMFRAEPKEEEYIAMEDVLRMLTWVRKESDCEQYMHQDTVDIFYERVLRDYKRALRDDDWEPEPSIADHPDEQLLARMRTEGLHRYVLEQVLLSTERSGRVRLRPGDEVIVQGVKSAEINNKVGKILRRDHNQKNYFAVSFPPPLDEKRIKRTNLRLAPGVEKKGDVPSDAWGVWTNLCLNLTPKIELDPAGVPLTGFGEVKLWLRRYLLVLLFLIFSAGIAVAAYYFHHDQREAIRSMFAGSGAIMGITGWVSLWLVVLTMLAGCQNILRTIPARVVIRWGGEATRAQWHLMLGVLCIIIAVLHSLAALGVLNTMTSHTPMEVNDVINSDFTEPTAAQLLADPSLVNATLSFSDVLMTWPTVSGLAIVGLLLLMAIASLVIGAGSTIGGYLHRLYILLVIGLMIHPMKGWFQVMWCGFACIGPFFLLYIVEAYYKWIAPGSFVAREYSIIKMTRGVVGGLEFRVKRPEGTQMVCQQSGEWVELMCPAISRGWQRAAVVTAPEIEDEMVKLQIHLTQNHNNAEWIKKAQELSDLDEEALKQVKIKGPLGLAACNVVTPIQEGGTGKLLLVGHYEGTLNLTAVINDLQQALERPDDALRRRVSKLHGYIESFVDAPPEKMLEVNIIAVCRTVEGHKRLKEAILKTLLVDMEMKCEVNISIYITQYAAQGTGAESWKRVRKIGSSEFAREGKRDEYHSTILKDIIHFGEPDWNHILLESRYRWLGHTVDVLYWGEDGPMDDLRSACKRHSYDPSRKELRASDKTVFNFYGGTSIASHDY